MCSVRRRSFLPICSRLTAATVMLVTAPRQVLQHVLCPVSQWKRLARFVSLSNEFKSKWDSQKAAILSQKKTEIDAHLQREDDIAQAEFAKTAAPCSCFL